MENVLCLLERYLGLLDLWKENYEIFQEISSLLRSNAVFKQQIFTGIFFRSTKFSIWNVGERNLSDLNGQKKKLKRDYINEIKLKM